MSRTRREQAVRLRGYRIRIYRPGEPSVFLPLLWRTDTPTDEWERAQQDSSIVQAILYRSGRKFKQFRRVEQGKEEIHGKTQGNHSTNGITRSKATHDSRGHGDVGRRSDQGL